MNSTPRRAKILIPGDETHRPRFVTLTATYTQFLEGWRRAKNLTSIEAAFHDYGRSLMV